MKIVLKNSQVIDIQGNTDALIYDATTNTLSIDSPTLGKFVVAFDDAPQVPDIRTAPTNPIIVADGIKESDVLNLVPQNTEPLEIAKQDGAKTSHRVMSDAHRQAIAQACRNAHSMRKMLDGKGNTILVHKDDFVDALQIGYVPKNSRVILHNPTLWANRKEGQTIGEMGVYFIDVVQGSKKISAAIEKIADLIQNQQCVLGYPERFQLLTSKK